MPETSQHKTRNQSTKFPCGKCRSECKDSTLQCFICGTWYHTGACSGITSGTLSNIESQSGLIWLCKNCEEPAKRKIRETEDQNTKLQTKVNKIEKKLQENNACLAALTKNIEREIDSKMNNLKECFDNKLDRILEKQDVMPAELKAAWPKSQSTPAPTIRNIMRETLEQQEKEKIDIEKRESNVVLFRVPESLKDKPDLRNADDVEFFQKFCSEGLQCPQMSVTSAIRLGERPKPEDIGSKPRPLKIVLSSKEEKAKIFNHLKNLKDAPEQYKRVSVSHDYSKITREQIKRKIEDARNKGGENADNYVYFIRGPAGKLEVQRRKKRNQDTSPPNSA